MRNVVVRGWRYAALATALVTAFVLAFTLFVPTFVANAEEEGHVLHVGGRANSWDGVDIHRQGMEEGDVLTVTGRVDGVPPEGTQMVLGGAESPWNWAANMAVTEENQAFTLELTLEENHIEEEQFVRFRIQTNGDGEAMSFFVHDIVHTRDGDVLYSLATDDYILGVDLGTTHSVISYWDNAAGRPEPIDISNGFGKIPLPSVVQFREGEGDEESEWVIGEEAYRSMKMYPETTIRSIKRQMGTNKTIRLGGKD